jgi:hypothetical protein
VSYAKVAGNHSTIKLRLMKVGDAALIVVQKWETEGDEWERETASDHLYAVDGNRLREVYQFESLREHTESFAEESARHDKCTTRLKVDSGFTGGVRNLIATTYANDNDPSETKIVWDKNHYVDCATCQKTEPGEAAPALFDPQTGRSIEPLLAKVLTGGRLDESDVKPLSAASLALLRNAPYARHGRPFKKAALQTFSMSCGARRRSCQCSNPTLRSKSRGSTRAIKPTSLSCSPSCATARSNDTARRSTHD